MNFLQFFSGAVYAAALVLIIYTLGHVAVRNIIARPFTASFVIAITLMLLVLSLLFISSPVGVSVIVSAGIFTITVTIIALRRMADGRAG